MKWYRTADGSQRIWYEDEEIERLAEDELRQANLAPTTSEPVTDLERFIEQHLRAALDLYADLPEDVLGMTEFDGDKQPRICINSDLSAAALDTGNPVPGVLGRWRATLAHEASHVMLHRVLFIDDLAQGQFFEMTEKREAVDSLMRCLKRNVGYGDGPRDWREIQANRGMAALLMPRRLFRRLALAERALISVTSADFDGELASRLSTRCEVSRQATSIRLSTLGIIDMSNSPRMFVPVA